MLDNRWWDYRSITIRPRPDAENPDSESGSVEQVLRVVQDLEGLEAKGWHLVSITHEEDDPEYPRFRVVLKRRRAAAAGEPNGTHPISSPAPESAPNHSSLKRAA